jgi:hypothetical protein
VSDEQDPKLVELNPAPDEHDEPAPTPFDNPFFLPCVLWALAAWFAWDVITGAEAYQKYPMFNIGGLAILAPAALYFTWSAIKERRAEREGSKD